MGMPRATLAGIRTIPVTDDAYLVGLTDLEIADGPRGLTLYTAGRGMGWLTAFDLDGGGAVQVDRWYIPRSHQAIETTDLIVRDAPGGGSQVVLAGLAPTRLVGLDASLAADPLSEVLGYSGTGFDMSRLGAVDLLEGGQVALAARNDRGLVQLNFEGGTGVYASTPLGADGGLLWARADAVATLQHGGAVYGIAAYGAENAVALLRVNEHGQFAYLDTVSVDAGLWVSRPGAVELIAGPDGGLYVVLGASGSDSLSVLAVRDGQLVPTDHVLDSRETRFQDASFIETAQIAGQTYVFAAGSDSGISVYALLAGGRLTHVETVAGSAALPLDGISALEVLPTAGGARLFVAAHGAPHLMEFAFRLEAPGATRVAAEGGGTVVGTGGDDFLSGRGGADWISGEAGDDVLGDGAGADTLRGGAGADLFVMAADGAVDRIADFELGVDRIELRGPGLVSDLDDIVVLSRSWGAELVIGEERLHVVTADGRALSATALREQGLILSRSVSVDLGDYPAPGRDTGPEAGSALDPSYLIGAAPDAPEEALEPFLSFDGGTRLGSRASERMVSWASLDVVWAYGGNDTIMTGANHDRIHAGTGNDLVFASWDNDWVLGGFGFDRLYGQTGNDWIDGGPQADLIDGGIGHDTLVGRAGFDRIYGQGGNDRIWGGETADRIWGGLGNDWIDAGSNDGRVLDIVQGGLGRDTIFGGSGFDLLDGGAGHDQIHGGAHADNLFGGFGWDTLWGGTGVDRLFGGAGNDMLLGGYGADGLFGQAGNDRIWGEGGNDRILAGLGSDIVDGGDGFDTIHGGAGFDTIIGGAHADTLWGRLHADRFVFADGHGHDRIMDFDARNALEVLDFSQLTTLGSTTDVLLAARQVGADVVIDTSDVSSIRLVGVNLDDLDGTDFLF